MAKGRLLNRVIILSRKINAISEGAENLYYRLLVISDDYGRFHADPEIIKGQIYTLRKIKISTIKQRLQELDDIKLIKIYNSNGEKYLEIVNFEKNQYFRKDIKRKSDFPSFQQRSRNEKLQVVTDCNVEPARQYINRNNNSNKNKNKDIRHKVINYLNEKAGKSFGLDSKDAIKYINGRVEKNKATFEKFKHVIDIKAGQWLDDDEYNKYLRPSTLFRESNFENYLNEKKTQQKKKSIFSRE